MHNMCASLYAINYQGYVIYIYVCMQIFCLAYMHAHTYKCTQTLTQRHIHLLIFMCVSVCVYVCVYSQKMWVYVFVCMCECFFALSQTCIQSVQVVIIGAIAEKVSFLSINAGYKCQILETHKYPANADDPAINRHKKILDKTKSVWLIFILHYLYYDYRFPQRLMIMIPVVSRNKFQVKVFIEKKQKIKKN